MKLDILKIWTSGEQFDTKTIALEKFTTTIDNALLPVTADFCHSYFGTQSASYLPEDLHLASELSLTFSE